MVIGSPVKGLTPFLAARAGTSLRASVPITGNFTRSPLAAAIIAWLKALSSVDLRAARLMRISPLRVTSAIVRMSLWREFTKWNLPPLAALVFLRALLVFLVAIDVLL